MTPMITDTAPICLAWRRLVATSVGLAIASGSPESAVFHVPW